MKQTRKVISILLCFAMLFTTVNAFAFSFDDYDDPDNPRFVDDYYSNKDSYYEEKTTLSNEATNVSFPARKMPHTVSITNSIQAYRDSLDMQNGLIFKIDGEIQQSYSGTYVATTSGGSITRLNDVTFTYPYYVANSDIAYVDNGVLGGTMPWSDSKWTTAALSASLVGASLIRFPMYIGRAIVAVPYPTLIDTDGLTGDELAEATAANYYIEKFTAYKNYWMKKLDGEGNVDYTDGSYSEMASFTADGDGRIIYVVGDSNYGKAYADAGWTYSAVTNGGENTYSYPSTVAAWGLHPVTEIYDEYNMLFASHQAFGNASETIKHTTTSWSGTVDGQRDLIYNFQEGAPDGSPLPGSGGSGYYYLDFVDITTWILKKAIQFRFRCPDSMKTLTL